MKYTDDMKDALVDEMNLMSKLNFHMPPCENCGYVPDFFTITNEDYEAAEAGETGETGDNIPPIPSPAWKRVFDGGGVIHVLSCNCGIIHGEDAKRLYEEWVLKNF